MDWSKAKTILIIALLITNILLAYAVIKDYDDEDPITSENFLLEVEEMLLEKKIELDTDIPTEDASLVPLIVEYETVDPDTINKLLFENKGSITVDGDNSIVRCNNKEVIILNNKTFEYSSEDTSVRYKNLTEKKVKEIAEDAINKLNFNREDMNISFFEKVDDKYKIVYSKKYNNIYLENAYIDIEIDSSGIKSLKRVWLNVKDKGDKEIELTKAPKAILSLLSKENAYGKTIENISLCNYFDPVEHEYIESPEDAREGKTIPAWRILFDDGSRIIIDNY